MNHKIYALIDPEQRDALISLFGSKWQVTFGKHLDALWLADKVPAPRQRVAPLHELVSVAVPVEESTWHWSDNRWEQPDEQMAGAIEELVSSWI